MALVLASTDSPAAPIRIEVDPAAYVLRVIRGNQTLRTDPVGLGYNGATPTGQFRIATGR
jgi:hypothetical protein